jgi:7,8-dihydroneopterin aldolase/epimerase/oxygenase
MADHIYLANMEFECHIGAGDGERADDQVIEVDVDLIVDLKPAGESDDLEKTVDYGAVYRLCQQVAEGRPYRLLEALAERLAAEILAVESAVQSVIVTVRKPGVPLEGVLEYAGVRVERSR